MANLVIDSYSTTPQGGLTATINGGVAPIYYSLDGTAPIQIQPVVFNGSPPLYFVSASGLANGSHTLNIYDSSNPQQNAQQQFVISAMQVAPGCIYTGPGNLQGNVHIDFDANIIDRIVLTGPNGYSEDSRNLPLQYPGLAVFVFLANGNYYAQSKNSAGADVQGEPIVIACGNSEPLTITSVATTNASNNTNATDGTATGAIVYGVQYRPDIVVQTSLDKVVWVNATSTSISNYSAPYTGLAAGAYTMYARVMDIGTGVATGEEAQYSFTVGYTKIYGCTNPNASNYDPNATDDDGSCQLPPIVPKPHFKVPLMNSLRFVEIVDTSNIPPTLDNRLYCAESWQGISRPPYYQKVVRADLITTQFQSNFDNNICSLVNYQTKQVVAVLPVVKKKQNLGVQIQYPAFLAPHPADITKTRLYFNSGQLPLAFVVGDRVEVVNATPASLNSKYTVSAVAFDATQSVPFLVVNLAYPTALPVPPRINITAQTEYDILPYNIYETTTDWGTLPNGGYYLQLEASSTGFDDVLYKSEPISLYPEHPGTNLVSWRNFDDFEDLTFTTGLNCGIRVESEIWQRLPGGTRKVYRAPDNRLIKLSSMPQRKVKMSFFWLPPWLLEKLGIAFDFDHVEVNGEEFQTEDSISEPQYVARYALANSSITLEKVDSVDSNSDDIGDINGVAPFIVVNERYLQV